MNARTATAVDELCDLITAQLDALEDLEPLTSDRLYEYQSRSEKIKVLCEELGRMNETEIVEELTQSAA